MKKRGAVRISPSGSPRRLGPSAAVLVAKPWQRPHARDDDFLTRAVYSRIVTAVTEIDQHYGSALRGFFGVAWRGLWPWLLRLSTDPFSGVSWFDESRQNQAAKRRGGILYETVGPPYCGECCHVQMFRRHRQTAVHCETFSWLPRESYFPGTPASPALKSLRQAASEQ